MPEYGKNGATLNLEHIVLKANNASAWASDYVLAAGELGIELDTKKYKLGDGATAWGELDYYTNPVTDNLVSGLTSRVTTAEGTLSNLGERMTTAEGTITLHGTRLDTAEGKITTAEGDIDAVEGRLDTAESDIDALEQKDITHETRMTAIEGVNTSQGQAITDHETRIASIEGITTISANPFRE